MGANVALSDVSLRRAKPSDKPFKLFDGGGLYLEITPAGGKHWRLKFRFAGKEKKLALGSYPEVTLMEARERALDAKRLLSTGADPASKKQDDKRKQRIAADNTFGMVAAEFMQNRMADKAAATIKKKKEILKNNLLPWLDHREVTAITAQELLGVVRKVESRGANELAHRCIQLSGQIFRYAIATGRAERNPAADLRGALEPVVVSHHAAITDPLKVGELLRAIDGYAGTFSVRCALSLAPMLFTRPGELRAAEWAEFDLDKAEWNIPAGRMKMREAHLVPLPRQAVAVLTELHHLTGSGRYLFPSVRSAQRPMSDNTVNGALRRLGFAHDEMTGHGFRAMARTILDEVLEIRPDLIEQQLAHAVKDPLGRAYNRTKFIKERKAMMQLWADYLDKLKVGADVMALPRIA